MHSVANSSQRFLNLVCPMLYVKMCVVWSKKNKTNSQKAVHSFVVENV